VVHDARKYWYRAAVDAEIQMLDETGKVGKTISSASKD
jgi:hypothetical protein